MKKRKREKKTSSCTTCTRKLEVLATAWWTCNQKKLSTSVCVRERTLNTQEYNEGCFINTYRNTTFRSVLPLARVYMPRARGLKMQTQCVPWLSVANGCAHGLGHLRHSIQAIHTVDNQTKWRQKKSNGKLYSKTAVCHIHALITQMLLERKGLSFLSFVLFIEYLQYRVLSICRRTHS